MHRASSAFWGVPGAVGWKTSLVMDGRSRPWGCNYIDRGTRALA